MRKLLTMLFVTSTLALGCAGEEMPEKPQIEPDRTKLQFGQEVGEAVYVGTRPVETLQLRNGGLEKLEIANVLISGPNTAQFKAEIDKKSVESLQKAFVQVIYEPTQAGTHTATLEITSNAENTPALKVELSAKAVNP